MRFNGNSVIAQAWCIGLLTLLTLPAGTMTSQVQQIHIKPVKNKRLNVEPRDVITRSSAIKCESTCRQTSWCTSANMAPDRSTCHLLSEEVSDVGSLEEAHGWSYLRKYIGHRNHAITKSGKYRHQIHARTVIHIYMQEQQTIDIDLCLLYCNKMWVRSYNSPANVLIMWWCSLCDDAHYVMMFKRSSYVRTHVSSSIPPLALVTSRPTLLRRATDTCFCQVTCWLTHTMTFDDTPLHIWLKSFLLWRHAVLRSDVYS